MKENQYDLVAPFYDALAKLIFGEKLLKAQIHYLGEMKSSDRVLIVGGGTGRILKHPSFLHVKCIDYVELSAKMMLEARQNAGNLETVRFLEIDFFQHHGEYDFIICNFFLDCFNEHYLSLAIRKLHGLLSQNGTLLVTDFKPSTNRRNKLLVSLMIIFFRLTTRLQAPKLQDIPQAMRALFSPVQRATFNNGLVFSNLLKPNP